MRPYRKRPFACLLNNDNNSEDSDIHQAAIENGEQVEKELEVKSKKTWKRKISRKLYRHHNIKLFTPNEYRIPSFLKQIESGPIKQPVVVPEPLEAVVPVSNESITEDIVNTLAGQKQPVNGSRIDYLEENNNNIQNVNNNLVGKHHLPAIVLPATTPRRESMEIKPLPKNPDETNEVTRTISDIVISTTTDIVPRTTADIATSRTTSDIVTPRMTADMPVLQTETHPQSNSPEPENVIELQHQEPAEEDQHLEQIENEATDDEEQTAIDVLELNYSPEPESPISEIPIDLSQKSNSKPKNVPKMPQPSLNTIQDQMKLLLPQSTIDRIQNNYDCLRKYLSRRPFKFDVDELTYISGVYLDLEHLKDELPEKFQPDLMQMLAKTINFIDENLKRLDPEIETLNVIGYLGQPEVTSTRAIMGATLNKIIQKQQCKPNATFSFDILDPNGMLPRKLAELQNLRLRSGNDKPPPPYSAKTQAKRPRCKSHRENAEKQMEELRRAALFGSTTPSNENLVRPQAQVLAKLLQKLLHGNVPELNQNQQLINQTLAHQGPSSDNENQRPLLVKELINQTLERQGPLSQDKNLLVNNQPAHQEPLSHNNIQRSLLGNNYSTLPNQEPLSHKKLMAENERLLNNLPEVSYQTLPIQGPLSQKEIAENQRLRLPQLSNQGENQRPLLVNNFSQLTHQQGPFSQNGSIDENHQRPNNCLGNQTLQHQGPLSQNELSIENERLLLLNNLYKSNNHTSSQEGALSQDKNQRPLLVNNSSQLRLAHQPFSQNGSIAENHQRTNNLPKSIHQNQQGPFSQNESIAKNHQRPNNLPKSIHQNQQGPFSQNESIAKNHQRPNNLPKSIHQNQQGPFSQNESIAENHQRPNNLPKSIHQNQQGPFSQNESIAENHQRPNNLPKSIHQNQQGPFSQNESIAENHQRPNNLPKSIHQNQQGPFSQNESIAKNHQRPNNLPKSIHQNQQGPFSQNESIAENHQRPNNLPKSIHQNQQGPFSQNESIAENHQRPNNLPKSIHQNQQGPFSQNGSIAENQRPNNLPQSHNQTLHQRPLSQNALTNENQRLLLLNNLYKSSNHPTLPQQGSLSQNGIMIENQRHMMPNSLPQINNQELTENQRLLSLYNYNQILPHNGLMARNAIHQMPPTIQEIPQNKPTKTTQRTYARARPQTKKQTLKNQRAAQIYHIESNEQPPQTYNGSNARNKQATNISQTLISPHELNQMSTLSQDQIPYPIPSNAPMPTINPALFPGPMPTPSPLIPPYYGPNMPYYCPPIYIPDTIHSMVRPPPHLMPTTQESSTLLAQALQKKTPENATVVVPVDTNTTLQKEVSPIQVPVVVSTPDTSKKITKEPTTTRVPSNDDNNKTQLESPKASDQPRTTVIKSSNETTIADDIKQEKDEFEGIIDKIKTNDKLKEKIFNLIKCIPKNPLPDLIEISDSEDDEHCEAKSPIKSESPKKLTLSDYPVRISVPYSPEIEPISPVNNNNSFTYPKQITFGDLQANCNNKSNHNNNNNNIEDLIPNGKLRYMPEQHAFLRYHDHAQAEMFLKSLENDQEFLTQTDLSAIKKAYKNILDTGLNKSKQTELITLPEHVEFTKMECLEDVEKYISERQLVDVFVPCDFARFYAYVTGFQIYNKNPPISLRTFLTMYNTNGLMELMRKYLIEKGCGYNNLDVSSIMPILNKKY
ncbi:unnamed protein product [Ceutorhynchus assimilis]|uniref:Uncharacterized protein n=1 Tax=Ceutorhynchus assimilis TaxID=467358 RepID=A0A9P0GT70_9CUCU|nr:unnamed protein product [Ceutorhynchus assimilis]